MPGMKAKGKIYPAIVLIYTHSHEVVLDLNSGEKTAQSIINYVWLSKRNVCGLWSSISERVGAFWPVPLER